MSASSIPLWRRPIDAFASSRLGSALISRLGPLLDRPLLRATGGRVAMTFGLPTLLLTTTGRKSGEPRPTPLLYLRHGADLVVIGSHFGSTRDPAWALNLRARAHAHVLLDGDEFEVAVREAEPAERETIWRAATQLYGGFEKYEARAGRTIPIFLLSRAS